MGGRAGPREPGTGASRERGAVCPAFSLWWVCFLVPSAASVIVVMETQVKDFVENFYIQLLVTNGKEKSSIDVETFENYIFVGLRLHAVQDLTQSWHRFVGVWFLPASSRF